MRAAQNALELCFCVNYYGDAYAFIDMKLGMAMNEQFQNCSWKSEWNVGLISSFDISLSLLSFCRLQADKNSNLRQSKENRVLNSGKSHSNGKSTE